MVCAVRGEPVKSDATAPTMIPKRNNVPVDPREVITEHA